MHRSFDGLRALAKQAMGRDPIDGDMFLFIARKLIPGLPVIGCDETRWYFLYNCLTAG
jgi:hypothetical protein